MVRGSAGSSSVSPGRSERRAGEVKLSGLEGDEERTLGGELFTPVGQRSAGQSQRLLRTQTSHQHPADWTNISNHQTADS